MGTDIHLNLEYESAENRYDPIISNSFYVSRDYKLFSALAGVRRSKEDSALFAPRGIPDDVSPSIFKEFYTEIIPSNSPDWKKSSYSHTWCYQSEADHNVEKFNCHIREFEGGTWVSNANWHSASYLSHSEIIDCLAFAKYKIDKSPIEFQMILDFMSSIEKHIDGGCARIVFWFDN